MRALVILIRLWPLWLILVFSLACVALIRRSRGGSAKQSPQTPGHGRPRVAGPDIEQFQVRSTAAPRPGHPDMGGIVWPEDVELPLDSDAEEKLDKGIWQSLCDVLNGQGDGQFANLLGRDGRFRARDGKRYTLYRATATFNGLKQPICVVVRIEIEGHVTARRTIVSMERPEVRFVDEPREESPKCPKGIAVEQATNTDATGMSPLHSSAVLLLAQTLVQATRAGDL